MQSVAVLHPTVTDAELKALAEAGVRGIRFTLGDPATAVVKVDMIEPLAKTRRGSRLARAVQREGAQIIELADLLRRLPTQLVFDHLANPPLPAGIEHPSHAIVRALIDKGPHLGQALGRVFEQQNRPAVLPGGHENCTGFVKAAPERLVWGATGRTRPCPKQQAERRITVRLLTEWGPRGGDAQPHPGSKSGGALRLRRNRLDGGALPRASPPAFTLSSRTPA